MEGVINSKLKDISIKPSFNFSKEQQKDLNILIREDMDNVKIKILEQILREKDIAFDPEIKDYNTLKKSLKQNVSKNTLAEINREEELAGKEIYDFINLLESGGPLTLQKTINTFNEKVLRPSAKFATTYLISRALFDSMLFLPFPVRTIVGVASLGPVVYKTTKVFTQRKKKDISRQYDELIEELKTVRNDKGEVITNQFSEQDFEIMKKFFIKQGRNPETLNYTTMITYMKKLDNKDKLDLIEQINNSRDKKINVNKELFKIRRRENINKIKNICEGVLLGTGVGMIVANFDKQITDLLDFSLSIKETEQIYKNRTWFAESLKNTDFIPDGVVGAVELVLVKNALEAVINVIHSKKKQDKNLKSNVNTPMSKNQKIVFEILKNRELHKRPENAERLNEINSIYEMKQYIRELPTKEQKQVVNLLEDVHKKIKVSNKTKNMKELGKMLGNSVVLAANSMLVYQIILMLKYRFNLPTLFLPEKNENNNTNTQDVLEPETVNVLETETSTQTSNVLEAETSMQTTPTLEPEHTPSVALNSAEEDIAYSIEATEPQSIEAENAMLDMVTESVNAVEDATSPVLETVTEASENIADPVMIHPEAETVATPVSEAIENSGQAIPTQSSSNSKISIKDPNAADAVEIAKKVGTAATIGTIAYFAIKGIAAAVTVIAPQLAPVTVPIIIGG